MISLEEGDGVFRTDVTCLNGKKVGWSVALSLFQSNNHMTAGFFAVQSALGDVYICKRNSSELVWLFCEEEAEESLEGPSFVFVLYFMKGIGGHSKMQNYGFKQSNLPFYEFFGLD